MQDELLRKFKLMQIIRINGNIYFLLNNGFDVNTLMHTMENLKETQLLQVSQSQVMLTKKGEMYFNKLSVQLGKKGLYKYFCNDAGFRIPQLSPEDIYIPRKRKKKK